VEKTLEGIEYVLKDFIQWGEQMEATQEVLDNMKKEISVVPGVAPKLSVGRIDVKKAQMKQVLKSLVRWTFRGYDDEQQLKRDGEILEINEENLLAIPASHGGVLARLVDEVNTIQEDVAKN